MSKIHTLDLEFLNESSAIASYLIETEDGPMLIETGPETTFEHLKKAIEKVGFSWKEVKHVLLTHIHFDHAGAAWKFAENGARIYVHPIGLPHLHAPEKLWNSAARIYGDDMDRLWGKMKPIPLELLTPLDDGDNVNIGGVEIRALYTPGHAIHHNAYQIGDIIFTGDVAGVKINGGPVVPPCPPPDIDLTAWSHSIEKLRKAQPKKLYLTHYDSVTDVETHLNTLSKMLDDWAGWMKPYYEAKTPPDEITPLFMEYTNNQLRAAGVGEEDVERYQAANPTWMSVSGLLRYWKLKEQGRL